MTEPSTNGHSVNVQEDVEMVRVLENLLDRDEDITARAVARLHPKIRHASSVTRNRIRADILALYQKKQKNIRNLLNQHKKRSQENIAEDIAKKNQRIADLERQVEVLTASHLAMICVVGELGGMSKWLKFFESYKDIRDSLQKLDAVPNLGKVTLIPHEK